MTKKGRDRERVEQHGEDRMTMTSGKERPLGNVGDDAKASG